MLQNPKMPKNKEKESKIWEYFTKLPDGIHSECKKCSKSFKLHNGSTGNMWQHVQNKHGVLNDSSAYYQNANSALQRTQPKVNEAFSTFNKYKKESQNYQDLTLLLCKYIIKEAIPVNQIAGEPFLQLMKAMNPR